MNRSPKLLPKLLGNCRSLNSSRHLLQYCGDNETETYTAIIQDRRTKFCSCFGTGQKLRMVVSGLMGEDDPLQKSSEPVRISASCQFRRLRLTRTECPFPGRLAPQPRWSIDPSR